MKKVFCLLSFLGVFSNSFSNNLDTNFENDTKNFRQENLLMEQKIKDNELKNFNPTDIKVEELEVNNENENKFLINNINITDSDNLLSFSEKDKVINKYINKELGASDIKNILMELTNKIVLKGYSTSSVGIRKNDLSTGILDLEIVAGKIEAVVFNEEDNLDKMKKFFLFSFKENDILNIRNIDTTSENFNYLQANNISIEILPGTKENYSIIKATNIMKITIKITCAKSKINIGPAKSIICHNFNFIILIDKNIASDISPKICISEYLIGYSLLKFFIFTIKAEANMPPTEAGKVSPVFPNNIEMIVPKAIANNNKKIACSNPFADNLFSVSSLILILTFWLWFTLLFLILFSTKYLPSGPPVKEPATNPNVAAANVIVFAALKPKFSKGTANTADVPWPPVIGIEPVASPISGFIPKILQIITPIPFCNTTRILETISNFTVFIPPFFKRDILAVKPILV